MTNENLPAQRSNGMAIGPRGIVPQNIAELFQLAELAVKNGISPRGMTVDQAAGIMAYALEIGLGAMAAFGVVASINGRVSLYGAGVPALLQSSGKLEEMKEWWDGSGDDYAAVSVMRRRGQGGEYRGEFSVADAKTAHLWGKQGPWSTHPKDMLMHKARRRAADAGFSDVLKGIPAAEDVAEITDMQRPELVQAVPVSPPGVRRSLPLRPVSEEGQQAAEPTRSNPPSPMATVAASPLLPSPGASHIEAIVKPGLQEPAAEPDYKAEFCRFILDMAAGNREDARRLSVELTTEADPVSGNILSGWPSIASKRATPEAIKRAYFKAKEAWEKGGFGGPPADGEEPAF